MYQTLVVDEIALEYEVSGAGEPIVFIHGAFIADAFRPLLGEHVLASRYQLITYRRRGYDGNSSSAGKRPISVERQATDCRALLMHLGVDRAHLAGHSFGGAVALQLALDAPELVHSLALMEPALFVGASGESYREALLQGTERYRAEGADVVMEGFIRARWPAFTRATLERALPGGFARAVADAPATFELDIGHVDWTFGESQAYRVTQPALVVLGAKSIPLHPRFGETYSWLLDCLPHAEGFVLPGATHFMHLEHPKVASAVATTLADFFGRHPIERAV